MSNLSNDNNTLVLNIIAYIEAKKNAKDTSEFIAIKDAGNQVVSKYHSIIDSISENIFYGPYGVTEISDEYQDNDFDLSYKASYSKNQYGIDNCTLILRVKDILQLEKDRIDFEKLEKSREKSEVLVYELDKKLYYGDGALQYGILETIIEISYRRITREALEKWAESKKKTGGSNKYTFLDTRVPFNELFAGQDLDRVEVNGVDFWNEDFELDFRFYGAFSWHNDKLTSLDGDTYNEKVLIYGYRFFNYLDQKGLTILVGSDW